MAVVNRISLSHDGSYDLASRVVFGTVDVAAVGSRVLMSLEGPPGWTVRETPLRLRGLELSQLPSGTTTTVTTFTEGSVSNEASQPLRPVLAVATSAEASPDSTSSSSTGSVSGPAVAMLLNFYPPAPGADAGARSPEVSLLIVNTLIPEAIQAEVAVALLELIEGRGVATATAAEATAEHGCSGPAFLGAEVDPGTTGADIGSRVDEEPKRSISLVAAMLLQQLAHPAALYQHTINGAAPLDPTLPPLQQLTAAGSGGGGGRRSAAIRVRDGLLAALLHVLEVSGTRACCLLAPGYKPPAATPLDLPGSLAACDAVGAALAAAYGLRYNAEKCRAVHALYKWFVTERSTGSDVMYV